ncbi:uncharacterized protein LOC127579910 [Pristis pectinata]|uniref:uncharacterized protein LOC127579910 n=1 Tax=Pristis pectinata TaxID=685728 RepID=UPI00223D63B6|nr:uncharacterized protein LOC127579910 [Pristis pectinata]
MCCKGREAVSEDGIPLKVASVVNDVEESMPTWLLHNCFETVDWSMFEDSAASFDEYVTTVTHFISKGVVHYVPKRTIRVFPNQKGWMNWEIHSLLKSRTAAFKSGDPDLHKKSRYDLWKAIRNAKRQYQFKIESQTSRQLWQGLNAVTGCKTKSGCIVNNSASLPDELSRKERENLVEWCHDNNLSLNISKTKELVIDSGKGVVYMHLSTSMVLRLRASSFWSEHQ